LRCPCCGCALRSNPRNAKARKKLRSIILVSQQWFQKLWGNRGKSAIPLKGSKLFFGKTICQFILILENENKLLEKLEWAN
jgi:hypothetical protein